MNTYKLAAALVAALGLSACGLHTTPAATGANSSAPGAVDQADHGVTGGGASPMTPQEAGKAQPAPLPR